MTREDVKDGNWGAHSDKAKSSGSSFLRIKRLRLSEEEMLSFSFVSMISPLPMELKAMHLFIH